MTLKFLYPHVILISAALVATAVFAATNLAFAEVSGSAGSPPNPSQPINCADTKGPNCKPSTKKPFRKVDFSPPGTRKPPKPPKRSGEPKDDLPERREDNF